MIVLVGKQLDPFALAIEQAFINVTGLTVPITEEVATRTREVLESLIRLGSEPEELRRFADKFGLSAP